MTAAILDSVEMSNWTQLGYLIERITGSTVRSDFVEMVLMVRKLQYFFDFKMSAAAILVFQNVIISLYGVSIYWCVIVFTLPSI